MRTVVTSQRGERREHLSGQASLGEANPMPCLRCGTCCTQWQPQLDAAEVDEIARRLGMTARSFRRKHVVRHPHNPKMYLFRRNAAACPFLVYEGGRAGCAIHEFKPEACRRWTPSLERPECRQGLANLGGGGQFVLPGELFALPDEVSSFCRSLRGEGEGSS